MPNRSRPATQQTTLASSGRGRIDAIRAAPERRNLPWHRARRHLRPCSWSDPCSPRRAAAAPAAWPSLSLGAAQLVDGDAVYKPKIHRIVRGDSAVQLVIYGNRPYEGRPAWDHTGARFDAGEVFVRRSADDGASWGDPLNLSRTAFLSSRLADGDGDPLTDPEAFHGDSGKPVVAVVGAVVVVVWDDTYAGGGGGPPTDQGAARYKEAGNLEVPYRALWVATSLDAGATWSEAQRLTDGARDVKQAAVRGASSGFALVWQEDPLGLRPGEGDGPGEGGSGATVNAGTDVWYTALRMTALESGASWPTPLRVSDNGGAGVEPGPGAHAHEGGSEEVEPAGASRPQVALFGTTAVVAYEETKGSGGTESGKYIRYHTFSAFDGAASMPDVTEGRGWILSTPGESGRRVRLLVQGTPGPATGLRILFCWRQGLYDCGGPADICCRTGHVDPNDTGASGFRPVDLRPGISYTCDDPEVAALDPRPLNLSSRLGLDAWTDDDALENARAHRGFLDEDRIVFAYVWSPDGAAADLTALANYDAYLRISEDGGATWSAPRNLTNLTDLAVSVREPRLVRTPSGPGRRTEVFLVAWSTELNQYEHLDRGCIDLDVFCMRTTDGGATFSEVLPVAATLRAEGESQWFLSPDGTKFGGVWCDTDEAGHCRGVCRGGTGSP